MDRQETHKLQLEQSDATKNQGCSRQPAAGNSWPWTLSTARLRPSLSRGFLGFLAANCIPRAGFSGARRAVASCGDAPTQRCGGRLAVVLLGKARERGVAPSRPLFLGLGWGGCRNKSYDPPDHAQTREEISTATGASASSTTCFDLSSWARPEQEVQEQVQGARRNFGRLQGGDEQRLRTLSFHHESVGDVSFALSVGRVVGQDGRVSRRGLVGSLLVPVRRP